MAHVEISPEWDGWLRDWQMSLKADGKRPDTLKTYERSARIFLDHVLPKEPDEVTPRDIEAFMVALIDARQSDATRRLRLMALRSLFGFMLAEPNSPLNSNPAVGIAPPVVEDPHIDIVTDETLVAVLKTCDKTFLGLRDTAIIRLMLACGLRRAELVGVDVDDLDLIQQLLVVHGKGGKARIVSIGGTKTPLALSRYIRARRKHPRAADSALFLVQRQAGDARMSGAAVAEMLRRRCRMAGVGPIHPHQLRHTWAHLNKVEGLSDEDLERMGGWSAPGMVRRYGRAMADQRALAAHARLAVGDRL